MMKKRYIAIISISTVALLFGGLIYCGISAFPELLEEEKNEEEAVTVKINGAFDHHYHHQEEANEEVTVVISNASNKNDENRTYTPINVSDTVNVVVISGNVKTKTNHQETHSIISFSNFDDNKNSSSFIDTKITLKEDNNSSHTSKKEITPYTYQKSIINDDFSFDFLNNKKSSINIENTSSSHSYGGEITLITIGIVEILSYILVKRRKRHLFR